MVVSVFSVTELPDIVLRLRHGEHNNLDRFLDSLYHELLTDSLVLLIDYL